MALFRWREVERIRQGEGAAVAQSESWRKLQAWLLFYSPLYRLELRFKIVFFGLLVAPLFIHDLCIADLCYFSKNEHSRSLCLSLTRLTLPNPLQLPDGTSSLQSSEHLMTEQFLILNRMKPMNKHGRPWSCHWRVTCSWWIYLSVLNLSWWPLLMFDIKIVIFPC
jgi:hypothetical protein